MKDLAPIVVNREQMSVCWHYCTGQVESLTLRESAHPFEWMRGIFGMPCGMCYLDKREPIVDGCRHTYIYMNDLRLTVSRTLTDSGYVERYEWQNAGKKEISIADGEVGVYVTFAEKYDIRDVVLPYRAYTHVMCAGDTFYIYNARCNGAAGGMGLVMQEGEVAEVQAERLHPRERGDLVAYMPAVTLAPQETVVWQWLVFAYDDVGEFWSTVRQFAHKLRLNPLMPEAGQMVTVDVDDVVPDTVLVDGKEVFNPFPAPVGDFVVAPIADDPKMVVKMQGLSHVERWARAYRGWGRAKHNMRDYIAESVSLAARFADTKQQDDYDRAVAALAAYYRELGAYRAPQAFLPALLIKSSDYLRQRFARHVDTVLRSHRGRFTAQTAFAEYDMLTVADFVFDGKYAEQVIEAKARALPLINTPFGNLIGKDS
jgi:hypothetical protein